MIGFDSILTLDGELRLAVKWCDGARMFKALAAGANPNAIEPGSDLSLLRVAAGASETHRTMLVTGLLRAGANPNVPVSHMGSPFFQICERHPADLIALILKNSQFPIDLMCTDENGVTPAMAVARLDSVGILEAMQVLFEREVWSVHPELPRNHLWVQEDNAGHGFMTRASVRRSPAVMSWLLSHPDLDMNLRLNKPDKHGRTPLSHAIEAGSSDVVALLLSHGAGFFRGHWDRESTFEHARSCARNHDPDALKVLAVLDAVWASRQASKAVEEALNPSGSRCKSPAANPSSR